MRSRIAVGAFGLGCAGLMIGALIAPSPATADPYGGGANDGGCSSSASGPCGSPDSTRAGAACDQAARDMPEGSGVLRISADVPDGSTVAPGQNIGIKLT